MNLKSKIYNLKFFALATSGLVHIIFVAFAIYSYSPAEVQAYQTIQISVISSSKTAETIKQVSKTSSVAEKGIYQQAKSEPEISEEPIQELAKLELESGNPVKSETEQDAVISKPSFSADYLRNPAPKYPETAKRKRQQGSVLLKVVVNQSGEAANVLLQSSSGSELLDKAAIDAVSRWKFVPAKRNDEYVTASVIVPIDFVLE